MQDILDADRPVGSKVHDRLGFAPIGERLAHSLVNQKSTDGLVVGIEGEWGSGKSSLINFTIEALRSMQNAPQIVQFSPWLISNRHALIENLFDEIDAAISRLPLENEAELDAEKEKSPRNYIVRAFSTLIKHFRRIIDRRSTKQKLRNSLRKFGKTVSFAGKFARYIPMVGDSAGKLMDDAGSTLETGVKNPSLAKQKFAIEKELRKLPQCIIIFIDDLDRLETAEAIEILRLVRAVADFPNLIYVLSYDPKILSHTVEKSTIAPDGQAFLEKIVQVSFKVPKPEAFDLRRWFQEDLEKTLSQIKKAPPTNPRDAKERLARVIDFDAGFYLETPRDVTRALNALRLYRPINHQIDKADLVWLQLLRVFDPTLYDMVERYMVEAAVVGPYARVSPGEDERLFHQLKKHFETQNRDIDSAMSILEIMLPGIKQSFDADHKWKLFNSLGEEAFHPFVASCRFGSPQHYRLYTAFSEPAGSLSDARVREFLSLLDTSLTDASTLFGELLTTKRPQGGVMAEILLDRILASGSDNLPPKAIENILTILANHLDVAATIIDVDQIDRVGIWGNAQRVFYKLFPKLPAASRQNVLEKTFGQGKALGWLSDLMRDEIFSHGHYGNRRAPESQWLLTADEFTWMLQTMTHRFADMPPEQLILTPKFVSLLYAWRQSGNKDQVRAWIGRQIESDDGLLNTLSRMQSITHSSSKGTYYPLKKRELRHFLDYDNARARVLALAENISTSSAMKTKAQQIAEAFNEDDSPFLEDQDEDG